MTVKKAVPTTDATGRPLYRAGRTIPRATTIYDAACKLAKLVNGDPELLWLLLLEYSERCLPPWEEKDLLRKLREAGRLRG